MAVSDQLAALVDQMPNPDGRGMFTENIDKDKIEQAAEKIAVGGRANIEGLVEMFDEPGTPADAKPHYALHCVANYTLIAKDEKARRDVCETLCKALDGEYSDYNKAFFCQTLQWAGRRESVPALGKMLTNEALCDPAAMALVAIKDGEADELRKAVPNVEGKCRLAVIDALAALAEPASASALKDALDDADREVRIAAGEGLSQIGEPATADALMKAADAKPGWERIQAAKNCMVMAETLAAAGKTADAKKVYTYLRDSRKDPSEAYVREQAEKALNA